MKPQWELQGRRMVLVKTASGELLRPHIREIEISVADDRNIALTYTVPDLRARRLARLKKIATANPRPI